MVCSWPRAAGRLYVKFWPKSGGVPQFSPAAAIDRTAALISAIVIHCWACGRLL